MTPRDAISKVNLEFEEFYKRHNIRPNLLLIGEETWDGIKDHVGNLGMAWVPVRSRNDWFLGMLVVTRSPVPRWTASMCGRW